MSPLFRQYSRKRSKVVEEDVDSDTSGKKRLRELTAE